MQAMITDSHDRIIDMANISQGRKIDRLESSISNLQAIVKDKDKAFVTANKGKEAAELKLKILEKKLAFVQEKAASEKAEFEKR